MLEIPFFEAVLADPIAAALVKNHVDGEVHTRGAHPSGVECQAAHFESEAHRILIFECTVKNRFAITRGADDLIGCALADLDPIALGVNEKKFVFLIVLELAADERRKIKGQSALLQGAPVFLGHPADLDGKK